MSLSGKEKANSRSMKIVKEVSLVKANIHKGSRSKFKFEKLKKIKLSYKASRKGKRQK